MSIAIPISAPNETHKLRFRVSAATGSDHSTIKFFKRFSAERAFSGALEHHFPPKIRAGVECAADPLKIVLSSSR
jgi:hypothetical protein